MIKLELGIYFVIYQDPETKKFTIEKKATEIEARKFLNDLIAKTEPQLRFPYAD